jgi:hypothetical protein
MVVFRPFTTKEVPPSVHRAEFRPVVDCLSAMVVFRPLTTKVPPFVHRAEFRPVVDCLSAMVVFRPPPDVVRPADVRADALRFRPTIAVVVAHRASSSWLRGHTPYQQEFRRYQGSPMFSMFWKNGTCAA